MRMKKYIKKNFTNNIRPTPYIRRIFVNRDDILNIAILIMIAMCGLVSCSDDSDVLEHNERKIIISFSGDVEDFMKYAQNISLTMTMPLQGDLYKGDSIIPDNIYSKELREENLNDLIFYKMWNRKEPALHLSCMVIYMINKGEPPKKMTMNVKEYKGNAIIVDKSFTFKTFEEKDVPRDDPYYFINNHTFSLEL